MMHPLWTFADIASATSGQASADGEAHGVSIDSRTTRSGDIFLAFKGPNQDGHSYVRQAMAKGAVGAIVSQDGLDIPDGFPTIVVEDTAIALGTLGQAARSRTNAKIIGVTGSVGKTGTKEALLRALARSGPTHASERSYNNDIGVPLTLSRMPADSEFGVLEMGMNHAGEMRALSAQARPDIAIITTIEAVHSEFFASVEGIADAKAEIFEHMSSEGVAILNRDNPWFDRLADKARDNGLAQIVSFGMHEDADVRLLKHFAADNCSTVSADIAGELLTYRIGIPGDHWVQNSLAVLAAVQQAGGELGLAGLALGEMVAPKGRGRRHDVPFRDGSVLVIDESYNASPISMRAALKGLAEAKGVVPESGIPGRRIAVLGDMLELGDETVSAHENLVIPVEQANVDLVYTAGSHARTLADALPSKLHGHHADSVDELLPVLLVQVQPGDVIMLKGSNSVGLSKAVDALLALGAEPAFPRQAQG